MRDRALATGLDNLSFAPLSSSHARDRKASQDKIYYYQNLLPYIHHLAQLGRCENELRMRQGTQEVKDALPELKRIQQKNRENQR